MPNDLLPRTGSNAGERPSLTSVVLHSGIPISILLLHSAGKIRRIKQAPSTDIENPFIWRRTFSERTAVSDESLLPDINVKSSYDKLYGLCHRDDR